MIELSLIMTFHGAIQASVCSCSLLSLQSVIVLVVCCCCCCCWVVIVAAADAASVSWIVGVHRSVNDILNRPFRSSRTDVHVKKRNRKGERFWKLFVVFTV